MTGAMARCGAVNHRLMLPMNRIGSSCVRSSPLLARKQWVLLVCTQQEQVDPPNKTDQFFKPFGSRFRADVLCHTGHDRWLTGNDLCVVQERLSRWMLTEASSASDGPCNLVDDYRDV